LPVREDEALEQNPKFWDLIEAAHVPPKTPPVRVVSHTSARA
jgi:hypothetical protein